MGNKETNLSTPPFFLFVSRFPFKAEKEAPLGRPFLLPLTCFFIFFKQNRRFSVKHCPRFNDKSRQFATEECRIQLRKADGENQISADSNTVGSLRRNQPIIFRHVCVVIFLNSPSHTW